MSTTNPVYSILVPSGNQAPLAAGSRPAALAVGQVGFFNYHTGLSVDATSPVSDLQDVVVYLGLNTTGAGGGATLEDIRKSAGQVIQTRNVRYLNVRGAIDPVGKVVEVTGYTMKCETDYGVKIEFRNQKSYNLNGYQPLVKSFVQNSGCCADACVGCGAGDGLATVTGLISQINNDPDKLVIATAFANTITATSNGTTTSGTAIYTIGTTIYNVPLVAGESATLTAARIVAQINSQTDSPYRASNAAGIITIYPKTTIGAAFPTIALTNAAGTGVTLTSITSVKGANIADLTVFGAAYPGVVPGLRITAQPTALTTYSGYTDFNYVSSGDTDIFVSGIGFECNGTITVVTQMVYAEGSGNLIRHMEKFSLGWGQGGPYRLSELAGMERGSFGVYPAILASASAKYNLVSLGYDQMSVGGWLEYLNNLETHIAVPCADTTTLTGIIAITDVIYANRLGVHTNDVTGMVCTGVVTSTLTPATDGVESLT